MFCQNENVLSASPQLELSAPAFLSNAEALAAVTVCTCRGEKKGQ